MSASRLAEAKRLFRAWREALDRRDLEAMATMLREDARGGNSVFGIVEGREALMAFVHRWPETVPNRGLWVVFDDERVVHKWRETLPGTAPDGGDYHYDGISEFHYGGEAQWSFMYGLPDVVALQTAYAKWKTDGHAATYGDVYPHL